jgi:NADH dehydrogenase
MTGFSPTCDQTGDARPGEGQAIRPRVVVVGGGFGGLGAVRALRRAPVDITLIDRRNFHLFQPLLYQVATAALSPGDIAWPIRSIFARQRNVTVLMMEICGIDPVQRTVTDGTTTLGYDYLIVATGATHAYFGHDDWEPFAPGLKTIADARALRERLLIAFEQAEAAARTVGRRRPVTILVVGGGATGVEMAGAIAELAHRTLSGEFRHTDIEATRVLLIEAGPRILPAFPEDLADVAQASLEAMRVEVHTAKTVTACDAAGVSVGSMRIDADLVMWAAGVRASAAAHWLGAASDRAGRVKVETDLTVKGHPDIFVIGDTAAVSGENGDAVPGLAPAAKQMGAFVGHVVGARVAGRPPTGPFHYRHMGDLATIGRNSAIVSLGRLKLRGRVGWLFWCLAHILFLVGFRSRATVAINWLWSYLTSQRGIRLISDKERPVPADLSAATASPAHSPSDPLIGSSSGRQT